MPIYDMYCDQCGPKTDIWAGVNDEVLPCTHCDGTMRRVFSATRSNPDYQPYLDENLCAMYSTEPTVIKSRQHRKEMMKRLGLVDKWSGM